MQTRGTWLLNYNEMRELGGTNYIEICQGYYPDNCWQENSIYVYYLIWEDFIDTLAIECIPDYNFLDFIDIQQSDSLFFSAQLLRLANLLQTVQTPQDFEKPEWYSDKVGRPYIHIGDNFATQLFMTQSEYQQQFYENFPKTLQIAENTYRQLAKWLQQHSQNGNAILGI